MNQKRDESRKTAQREIYNLRHQKRVQVHFGGRQQSFRRIELCVGLVEAQEGDRLLNF